MKRIQHFYIYLLCLVLFLPYSVPSAAQHPHPAFRHYTVENGLANSELYQIKQDSRGYIWFATGNGVSRFNGYEFENFSVKDGLADNTVFEIQEDRQGRIWFCPLTCMLSYYDYADGKIHPYIHNEIFKKAVKYPFKSSFYIDSNYTVYIGLYHDGIFSITADGKLRRHTSQVPYIVMEPEKGHFLFSDTKAPAILTLSLNRDGKEKIIKLPFDVRPNYRFGRMIRHTNGHIYLSLEKFIFVITDEGTITMEVMVATVAWLYEDHDHDLWIGTYQDGAYRVRNENFAEKEHFLPGQIVNGILQDNEEGIWFGTYGNSVFYAPSENILTYDQVSGLHDDRVNCLETDGENVFAGGQDGYIYIFSKEGKMREYNTNLFAKKINTISNLYYDKEEKVLFYSSAVHAARINIITSKEKLTYGFFYQMLKDGDSYWISHSKGMCKFDTGLPEMVGERKRLYAILDWENNNILCGGIDGLWLFNKTDYRYKSLNYLHPALNTRISQLSLLSDSTLLIGTKGSGMLICRKDRIAKIDMLNGLCDNQVNSVYQEKNTLWIATNKGLNKVVMSEHDPFTYTIRGLTVADGLASEEVNDVIVVDDKVWVATNKGLSFLYKDDLQPSGYELPVLIDKISINGKDTVTEKYFDLAHDQNNVQIRFLTPGYRNAGKHQYRYKMEGLDTAWNYTMNREIQFTTLPAGKYNFIVAVKNANGTWSSQPATVTFVVYAPFWIKWWFYVAWITALMLFVGWLVRFFLRRTQLRKEKNENLNRNLLNLKLKALRAQMNPHFTFNVMNSIQHFILHKDEESAHRYLSKFSRLVRAILNNSEKETVSIGEEIKALELYLELESMRFENGFRYEILVDKSIDTNRVQIPSMLLQPYVENAILHGILPSQKEGKILVEIKEDGNKLVCSIEDNGIGRVKAAERKTAGHRSFGTFITKERLKALNELHHSSLSEKIIDLYDAPGNATGTRVEIFIPLLKNDEYEGDHN